MTENKNITIQKSEPDLCKRSIKGGYWVFASNILELVKTIIIAHLFYLEDLGLLSISYMLISLLRQFSGCGFETAIIQKKESITREDLDTTWVVGILRGVVLFLILFCVAPYFVVLINKTSLHQISIEKIPLAISIIRVIGLCFLIEGFRNIGILHFQKDLNFHKIFHLSIIGTLSDFILTVVLVIVFKSLWGVIISRVIVALIQCLYGYKLSSYRPRFHFHLSRAKKLWKFGKWIYGQQIIGYFMNEGDDFFVLFYLGLPFLALYRHAFRFSTMPATHITNVISQVSFPAFSKIQDDLPRLKDAYLKVLKMTSLACIPTAFLIFILGPDFVHLFLPEQMYPIIPAMQILAVKGLFKSIDITRGPLFYAVGKPQIIWHLRVLRLLLLASLIYPFTKVWGIVGTATATALLNIITGPLGLLVAKRLLKCTLLDMLGPSLLPSIASIIMLIWIMLLKIYFLTEPSYITFALLAVSAGAVYIAAIWMIDLSFDRSYTTIFKEQIDMIKRKV
jgi:O-antigen/teichoic acid export membrane protein